MTEPKPLITIDPLEIHLRERAKGSGYHPLEQWSIDTIDTLRERVKELEISADRSTFVLRNLAEMDSAARAEVTRLRGVIMEGGMALANCQTKIRQDALAAGQKQ